VTLAVDLLQQHLQTLVADPEQSPLPAPTAAPDDRAQARTPAPTQCGKPDRRISISHWSCWNSSSVLGAFASSRSSDSRYCRHPRKNCGHAGTVGRGSLFSGRRRQRCG
jgi:hypothetical protein